MFPIVSATRSQTKQKLLDDYSKFTVQIWRKPNLEKLFNKQRAARIFARRGTTTNNPILFQKIRNAPFKSRRQTIHSTSYVDNRIDLSNANSSLQSVPLNIVDDQLPANQHQPYPEIHDLQPIDDDLLQNMPSDQNQMTNNSEVDTESQTSENIEPNNIDVSL